MNNCGNCANYNTERMCHTDICGECFVEGQNGHISGKPSKWKPLPLTNGDKIRAMTDEEFAKAASATFRCPVGDYKCLQMPEPFCYECWLAWLKQPVEVDHETC